MIDSDDKRMGLATLSVQMLPPIDNPGRDGVPTAGAARAGFAEIARQAHRLCGGHSAPDLPASLEALVQTRRLIRWLAFGPPGEDHHEWDTGGCALVSEALHDAFGVEVVNGCFNDLDDDGVYGVHFQHFWNVLPDGRILDVTADQFGICPILIGQDERYLLGCACGTTA